MGAVEADLKAERARRARPQALRARPLGDDLEARHRRRPLASSWSPASPSGTLLGGDDPESSPSRPRASPRSALRWRRRLEVQGDEGTLHVVKLPGLPPDKDYQAWIQRDGDMEPSSTFDVREDGEVAIDGSLEGADGVYITREPEGGSEEPTRADPIMGVELS